MEPWVIYSLRVVDGMPSMPVLAPPGDILRAQEVAVATWMFSLKCKTVADLVAWAAEYKAVREME